MANINRQAPPHWGDDLERAFAERHRAAVRDAQAPPAAAKRRVKAGAILKYCVAALTLAAVLYAAFE